MKECRRLKKTILKLQSEKQELLQVNFNVTKELAKLKENLTSGLGDGLQFSSSRRNVFGVADNYPGVLHQPAGPMNNGPVTPPNVQRSKSTNKFVDMNSILDFHAKFLGDIDPELSSVDRFPGQGQGSYSKKPSLVGSAEKLPTYEKNFERNIEKANEPESLLKVKSSITSSEGQSKPLFSLNLKKASQIQEYCANRSKSKP